MTMHDRMPRIALVVDPRFPGGTSSAVAHEIATLRSRAHLTVHALDTRMFRNHPVNPTLARALDAAGLELVHGAPVIRSEVVVLHNPSCLKFDKALGVRILCDTLLVVTHENVLRPDGTEGFDVAGCLRMIDQAAICRTKRLCPVSAYNRQGVETWLAQTGAGWTLAPFDWFNICDFDRACPNAAPRDRRGRVSRPGFEKFPPIATMKAHFPPRAEACRILGGDNFLLDPAAMPRHWEVLPFGSAPVSDFLQTIDFFVYFTHPQWRESFGRVIAEAIAAGKLVITDPGTATTFGGAVQASDGNDVDAIIAGYLDNPAAYVRFVERAQDIISGFGPDDFAATVLAGLQDLKRDAHALL